jgi:uncharacterized protein (DUF3084 family)
MRITWLLANLVLFALFGWGTLEQISNQKQTNQLMGEVYNNIVLSYQLTKTTTDRLQPLPETAATIEQMNQKLDLTRKELTQMNQSLARVTVNEQKIITGLDRLNADTSVANDQLKSILEQNGQLVPLTRSLATQTDEENGLITALSRLTRTSIGELRELNEKLTILSVLP